MIRLANKNDINRIAEIELFVNRFNFCNILSNEILYGKISYEYNINWLTRSFDDMEKNRGIEYYIFEDNNIIKGYFSIGYGPNNEQECEIINICIDVPFQNKKYGTILIDYCIELLKNRGKKIIRLNVFENNITAIKLYEKQGFIIEKKYFSEEWKINILKYKKEIK
ncbi:MAG: GNAT family N-acetyltransferase [Treponema sp.]|nr:GNAT family N-acetyltransferase [Treponema sp.]